MVGLALLARLAYVAATPHHPLTFDAKDYQRLAVSVANGHGFGPSLLGGPTAYRPPLYPYFLAAIYRIGGIDVTYARVTQAVVGAATVAMIGVIAGRLWSRQVGLVAMALAALFPPFVILGSLLFAEPLAVFLELLSVLFVMRACETDQLRWAIAGGVGLGATVLARPNAAVIGVAFIGLLWTGVTRRRLTAILAMVSVAAACVAPWTVRNAREFGRLIPITTSSGYTAAGTYNDTARHDPVFPASWHPAQIDPTVRALIDPALGEAEIDERLQNHVAEYIRAHPTYVARVVAWNTVHLLQLQPSFDWMDVTEGYGVGRRAQQVQIVAVWLILVAALVGCWLGAIRSHSRWFWAVPMFAVLAVLPINTDVRFRHLADPFLILLAAFAVSRASDRVSPVLARDLKFIRRSSPKRRLA